jgi:hypothetical protein
VECTNQILYRNQVVCKHQVVRRNPVVCRHQVVCRNQVVRRNQVVCRNQMFCLRSAGRPPWKGQGLSEPNVMSLRLLLAGHKMHVSCAVRSFPGAVSVASSYRGYYHEAPTHSETLAGKLETMKKKIGIYLDCIRSSDAATPCRFQYE